MVAIHPSSYQEVTLGSVLAEDVHTCRWGTTIHTTCLYMSFLIKRNNQEDVFLEVFNTIIVSHSLFDILYQRKYNITICRDGTALYVKEVEKQCHNRFSPYIFTSMLKYFHEHPTHVMELREFDEQMVQDRNFKLVKRKTITYEKIRINGKESCTHLIGCRSSNPYLGEHTPIFHWTNFDYCLGKSVTMREYKSSLQYL